MHPSGVWALARSLGKGPPGPSLLFRYHAKNTPDRLGLVAVGRDGERRFSFAAMDEAINHIAAGLVSLGVRRRDAVLLACKNRSEFLLVQAAVGRIGAACVAVSWRSTPSELEWLANHARAVVLLFDADIADVIRETAPRLSGLSRSRLLSLGGDAEGFRSLSDLVLTSTPEPIEGDVDASVVTYTSGTTGKPKGAVRKFPRAALACTLAFIGQTPMAPGDVHLACCPLYHATAYGFVGLSYILGATVVLLEEFAPEAFLGAIERHRVTTTALVPTMLRRVLDLGLDTIRRYDLSSLRAVFCGGAALSPALAEEALGALGDVVFNFYGATETGLVTLADPADLRASPGTIGRVVPGNEIVLFGEDGRPVPRGSVGELYVRSPMIVEGYDADPSATIASMKDGFFSVGDLAREDERGCFHLQGRKRDMIISGGVNVYPIEIESTLEQHPDVLEAAVVGVPDRDWGERVRACVVRRPQRSVDAAVIQAHCKQRLSGAKVPREVVFMTALPRNPTGKVSKRELVVLSNEILEAASRGGA